MQTAFDMHAGTLDYTSKQTQDATASRGIPPSLMILPDPPRRNLYSLSDPLGLVCLSHALQSTHQRVEVERRHGSLFVRVDGQVCETPFGASLHRNDEAPVGLVGVSHGNA